LSFKDGCCTCHSAGSRCAAADEDDLQHHTADDEEQDINWLLRPLSAALEEEDDEVCRLLLVSVHWSSSAVYSNSVQGPLPCIVTVFQVTMDMQSVSQLP
jgi:hypothetical protein